MKKFVLAALILGALTAPQAFAADYAAQEAQAIRNQQAEIRAGVEARSGRYKDMSGETRATLLTKQSEVLRTLEGKQSTAELTEQQKIDVFNSLEWIEAAINNADDERLVCERRAVLGSNRKERVCRTASQMRAERELARRQIEQQKGGDFGRD
ncbi:hypothetical protein [Lysobacter silvisoli]|uniref:Uncharacterized protein n=1 Tax=Lysobacter silvisoli TaxID=2293254 RepID=A0A371JYS8_9GAMM|nr:hypothetical protein [Lysobacter silvisoli]RDZ26784.1 hypothetical protein DX914_17600 [Lysobacter silvisoli]